MVEVDHDPCQASPRTDLHCLLTGHLVATDAAGDCTDSERQLRRDGSAGQELQGPNVNAGQVYQAVLPRGAVPQLPAGLRTGLLHDRDHGGHDGTGGGPVDSLERVERLGHQRGHRTRRDPQPVAVRGLPPLAGAEQDLEPGLDHQPGATVTVWVGQPVDDPLHGVDRQRGAIGDGLTGQHRVAAVTVDVLADDPQDRDVGQVQAGPTGEPAVLQQPVAEQVAERNGSNPVQLLDRGGWRGTVHGEILVVRGLGNPDSYHSAPHGAGRVMSRSKAKKTFTADDLTGRMGDRAWLSGRADSLIDEHPDAYKPITKVMDDAGDLVEVVEELVQVLNYKGC